VEQKLERFIYISVSTKKVGPTLPAEHIAVPQSQYKNLDLAGFLNQALKTDNPRAVLV
jgi:hypothetical protein